MIYAPISLLKSLARKILPPRIRESLNFIRTARFQHHAMWYINSRLVRIAILLIKRRILVDADFAKHGFKLGVLSEANITKFAESLLTTPDVPFSEESSLATYYSPPGLQSIYQQLNLGQTFLSLGQTELTHLHRLLLDLAEPAETCIGSPWRVVNVRCWRTSPAALAVGATAWHTDGFPIDILKVMIYLSAIGPKQGTTELKLKDGHVFSAKGPAGTWLLFRNSELLHRGVPPEAGERIVVEVTLVPWLTHDQHPVCAGTNAQHPKFPWSTRP